MRVAILPARLFLWSSRRVTGGKFNSRRRQVFALPGRVSSRFLGVKQQQSLNACGDSAYFTKLPSLFYHCDSIKEEFRSLVICIELNCLCNVEELKRVFLRVRSYSFDDRFLCCVVGTLKVVEEILKGVFLDFKSNLSVH